MCRYFYISILYNVCYTLALYGLILFWNGASELLQPFNPLLKFVLVKTVVFLTFWQVGCEAASLAAAAATVAAQQQERLYSCSAVMTGCRLLVWWVLHLGHQGITPAQ